MDTYDLVSKHPLLAILRNVPLEKTIDYAEAAVQGGAPFFEVALNSPHALEQITMLRTHFGDRCTVGAGTAGQNDTFHFVHSLYYEIKKLCSLYKARQRIRRVLYGFKAELRPL